MFRVRAAAFLLHVSPPATGPNKRSRGDSTADLRFCFARPEGFEPPTFGLEVRRSIQLSYGRLL